MAPSGRYHRRERHRRGRPLVQEFLKNKTRFGRIAVLADPTKISRFTDVQSQGVEGGGFDTVISLTGNTAMKLQPGMIDAAIAGGVRHFYPSELGTDSYVAIGKRRYFRDKIATREHLRDRGTRGAGLLNHTAVSYGVPDALISVTALPDIVRYVVESVLLPLEQGKSCRELRVAGETLTWATLIETLGEVQGVKYNVTYLEPAGGGGEGRGGARRGKTLRLRCCVAHLVGTARQCAVLFTPENAKETLQRLIGKK
ncbi:hypothetical protein B0H14DRAFT_3081316 [Mycena olivaceomarginata]|nr:hypothetical protein B0H14DRAFT_3081316 [Mycena olivaceomarginata]